MVIYFYILVVIFQSFTLVGQFCTSGTVDFQRGIE